MNSGRRCHHGARRAIDSRVCPQGSCLVVCRMKGQTKRPDVRHASRRGGAVGAGGGNMMAQLQKLQDEMAKTQEKLHDETVEVTVGGGMIKAVMNGHQKLISITIAPEAVDPDDVEMLQDMILAAVNEAVERSQGWPPSAWARSPAGWAGLRNPWADVAMAQNSRQAGRRSDRGPLAVARHRAEDRVPPHVLPAARARWAGARARRCAARAARGHRGVRAVLQHRRGQPVPHLRRPGARLSG